MLSKYLHMMFWDIRSAIGVVNIELSLVGCYLQHGAKKVKCLLIFRLPTQCFCQDHPSSVLDKSSYPQNADFPRYYSKKEKKPFPIPILELRRAARERQKKARGKPRRPTPPPRNGMLVRSLIPVAYEVMNARILLINNLKRLMKVVPVRACKYLSPPFLFC